MSLHLHLFDLAVVGLYLVAITLFGLRFSRHRAAKGATAQDRSLRGYFLANKTIPWWAIGLSIVSAETSTLTIIGTPGLAFAGDFGFLQIVLGYMCGRVVVAALFLPKYFQGEMMTAYQLIDRRFGHTLHKVTAGLFLLTRAAAEGVRVFAVSIVVGIAIGTGDVLSIAIISALTLLYTFEGGMAAVIWTDVVQMAIYIGGTLVAIWSLGAHVPGGWATIHAVGAAAGRFHMLNFAMNLTTTYTFWAGVLGGTFLTMASHGTDQLMVQRMLAARNLSESRLALLSSGVVIFIQFALFLLIGAGLFVFYGMHPAALAEIGGGNGNRIFPAFIVYEMPTGIAGLLIAAILAAAMSNLSAALNSLSSTTVVDFYMGWRPQAAASNPSAHRERMLVSRGSTVLWALVLFAVAVYAVHTGGKGNVVEIGLSIASVAYGCLLGVFLLGTLTKYATQGGAIVGMITGFALNMALWLQKSTVHAAGVKVPKVAWTWYVLIGALVTFAVGSLASVIFRSRARKTATAAALLLTLSLPLGLSLSVPFLLSSRSAAQGSASPAAQPTPAHSSSPSPANTAAPDFSAVSLAINTAIAQHKLPGAVVVIGHRGKIVFEQAYGVRKLAGEPGLDGTPSPAEPMTTDTIFDMASTTKVLVTATAIMQLYEAGKLDLDDPVAQYLPEFAANGKQVVTIRELLTHYSDLPPDVDLKDAWGLAKPDKAEGIRRALAAPLTTTPGTHFEYSDINYIVLGALVEKLSGERLDTYAQHHIFEPLQMTRTRYLAIDEACGDTRVLTVNFSHPAKTQIFSSLPECISPTAPPMGWNISIWVPKTAPTAHDNEGTAETNPDFDHLLRGTVHDSTTRRMGGVAGHAGVFSTADDTALFAQSLLDRLAGRPSNFPLKRETLELMTTPQQPETAQSGATIFTQDGKTTTGIAQRGLGWDINSAFSRPRGSVFPTIGAPVPASFGHTGFTGTSLWLDPASDSYVILLSNAIHPRGNPPISTLRGEVATAAAKALELGSPPSGIVMKPHGLSFRSAAEESASPTVPQPHTLTGIDVLESTNFAALKEAAARNGGHLRLGLLTNQTGLDAHGRRTIDILNSIGDGVELTKLFSPEHGLFGAKDSTNIGQEIDATTGLKVISLYGAKEEDRRPKHEDMLDIDAVVIDLQDAGVRFYTYETVLYYFLEATGCDRSSYNFKLIVLDRPNPIAGLAVEGPVSDAHPSYINATPLPLRHGMTLGELAAYMRVGVFQGCYVGGVPLPGREYIPLQSASGYPPFYEENGVVVVPMQNWHRDEFFDQTGVPWVNPSPNLRSTTEATLYPALGMMDFTNVSVGRGTATPFEIFGAGVTPASKDSPATPAWFDGKTVAAYLTARKIPGVAFAATHFSVAEDANHYPYHGQTIEGVRFTVTDRAALDSPELGIEILSALHHLYPTQFKLDKATPLVANSETMAALTRGDDPRLIAASWAAALEKFKQQRAKVLLYP
ncbi:MAG: sodium/solute symporter [Acidobacteriaceae bacterium]|nr:sodium/solute symporter [Acidobacteriaceae bacterium]